MPSSAFTATMRMPATAALPAAALPAACPAGLRGVLLWLLIEFPLALVRAEVVIRALKLGFCGSPLFVYLHSTNRISLHCHVVFSFS
jgi:hypothetical protein